MADAFVHLRVHSDYSLGRGTSKVKQLIKRASELGFPAMALTDEANLHAALEFSDYAPESGLQPVLGVSLPFSVKEGDAGTVLLLAQNAAGYANICRLTNMALHPARGFVGVNKAMLQEIIAIKKGGDDVTAGIIAIAGAGGGSFLGRMAAKIGEEKARTTAAFLAGIFKGRFYVEICRNGAPTREAVEAERMVLAIAEAENLPIVATSEVWYATEDRHDAFELLHAVQEGQKGSVVANDDGIRHSSAARFHMRSSEEMAELFDDLPEAYANAAAIARRCAFKAGKRNPILPPFPTLGGISEAEEMRRQAAEGLEARFEKLGIPEERRAEYRDRLDYELGIIEKMGFPGYFLIVSDFIKFAKSRGIPVGPGRGSGAGSVVAWALTITDIDPLPFGLLFERFLNPERVSMPDFDIDFCQDGRQEVIDYVKEKYGEDKVAQIVTFMEIKSKTAIRDVARVLKHESEGTLPQMEINGLCDLIPKKEGSPDPQKLDDAFKNAEDFRTKVTKSKAASAVFANARKVEGLYRNSSAHAAGIIIGGDTLTKLVPVGFDQKSKFPVVQLNMKDSEKAGLVKFDFLGLKTLSVIREAVDHVKKTKGYEVDFDTLPYDDAETYAMLAQGRSNGVFQLESDGMKRVLKDIRPTQIEDLIAVVSLYRPGPMDMIPTYARRKNGLEKPQYPEPADQTSKFLSETYGIMVYQEQVMQVAQVVAGYSLGGADLLRRAMGKKIKAEMDQQKQTFVAGAVERGTTARKAEELFDLIEKFSGYGFNKSHAAAYAVIAYRTAWLKRHHGVEFFSALMSYETDSPEKMALIKQDMDQFGMELLPPDINASQPRFSPEEKPDGTWAIRFGLTAVKGVSETVDGLVQERKKKKFESLEDFSARAGKFLNSGQTQKLVEAGAFDSIAKGMSRQAVLQILLWLAKNEKKTDTTSANLFGDEAKVVIPKKLLATPEWPNAAELEYLAVGFFFRQHPLQAIAPKLNRLGARSKAEIAADCARKRTEILDATLYGMVEHCELKVNERGIKRISLKLAERDDTYWVSVYPKHQDIEKLHKMLEGEKRERRPVVVKADFVLKDRNDVMVWGREIHRAEDYILENRTDTGWLVRFDLRKAAASKTDWYRGEGIEAKLAEIDARARADAAAGRTTDVAVAAAFDILRDVAHSCVQEFYRNLESLAEVSESPNAVGVEFEIPVKAGDAVKYITIKTDDRRWIVNRNALIAVAHNPWTEVDEVEDMAESFAPAAA